MVAEVAAAAAAAQLKNLPHCLPCLILNAEMKYAALEIERDDCFDGIERQFEPGGLAQCSGTRGGQLSERAAEETHATTENQNPPADTSQSPQNLF